MKTKTLLIAAAMFLALSAVAFSQVATYSVSSTPITTVIATGNAEPAGNITFTQGAGTTTTGSTSTPLGTITIQYGGNNVNITSAFSAIGITGTGGYAATTCTNPATAPSLTSCTPYILQPPTSQYQPGLLVIAIPFGVTSGTFTVTGVRVQVNGTGLTNLVANISATGNQINAGSTSVTVINNTTGAGIAPGSVATFNAAPPIASGATTGNTIINAVSGTFVAGTTGTTTIKVGEGFLGAWSQNVGVRVTVTATPPKGVTFTFPNAATSYDASTSANTPVNSWVRGVSTSTTAQTGTAKITSSSTSSSSLAFYYYVATDVGSTIVETLEIPVTITVDTATASNFPLAAGVFSVNVSLAPIQGPLVTDTSSSNFGTPVGLLAPRFAAKDEGPATLCQIQGSSTALLIPYGYASTTAGDFNTAMAIANTTEDPGSAVLGFTGATPNAGPVTFYLFPLNTTLPMFTYKTIAGSPGSGLDANGNVISGGTYSVFLSQIFPLATPPTGSTATIGNVFQGYIIIVTGFTNGHGIFVISNFTTLTAQSSLMMVLNNRAFPEVVTF